MRKIILASLLVLWFFTMPGFIVEELRPMPPIQTKPLSIPHLIAHYASKYQVSEKTLNRVIKCESGYNTKAIGDGGTSFGLVQIHLIAHPTISKAQAFDPEFAIDFLAKGIKKGKGNMWTCF